MANNVRVAGQGEALPDELREQYIKHAGLQLEAAYARWNATGCRAHRAAADSWRQAMEGAIRARSATQTARLERERGLR